MKSPRLFMLNHGKSQFLEYHQKPKKKRSLVRHQAAMWGAPWYVKPRTNVETHVGIGWWTLVLLVISQVHSNSQDFENNISLGFALTFVFVIFLISKWWQWLKQPGNLGGLSWHVRTRWKWLDELMKISKAGFGSRYWKTLPRIA